MSSKRAATSEPALDDFCIWNHVAEVPVTRHQRGGQDDDDDDDDGACGGDDAAAVVDDNDIGLGEGLHLYLPPPGGL